MDGVAGDCRKLAVVGAMTIPIWLAILGGLAIASWLIGIIGVVYLMIEAEKVR